MELLDDSAERRVGAAETAVVFVAALGLCLGLQHQAGAWEADLSGHPDEASHFVSAVMVYQYASEGAPEPPTTFAKRYYAHYPKVAIGHWPPGFHAMLGAWFGVAGLGLFQAFLLIACILAATAAWLYRWAVPELSRPAAAAAAAAFLLLPLSGFAATHVMTEAALALFCAIAVGAYTDYLKTPGYRSAALFGLAAAAALLTKGAAAGLALTPPLAVAATRRFDLLRKAHFWTPAAIVLALAGPWYFAVGRFVPVALGGTVRRVVGLNYLGDPTDRLAFWVILLGTPLAAAAAAGLWMTFLRPAFAGGAKPIAAAAGGFVAGVAVFLYALPESGEPRHIHQVAPLVLFFAAWAVERGATALPLPKTGASAAAAAVIVACALWKFHPIQKPNTGLAEAAEFVLDDEGLRGGAVLVSSLRFGEGAAVAAAAGRRPHPDVAFLRATKVLADTSWAGGRSVSYFAGPEEVADWLEELPVGAIIVDNAPAVREPSEHRAQLEAAIAARPQKWRKAVQFSAVTGDLPGRSWTVDVYRSTDSDVRLRTPVEMEMQRKLK